MNSIIFAHFYLNDDRFSIVSTGSFIKYSNIYSEFISKCSNIYSGFISKYSNFLNYIKYFHDIFLFLDENNIQNITCDALGKTKYEYELTTNSDSIILKIKKSKSFDWIIFKIMTSRKISFENNKVLFNSPYQSIYNWETKYIYVKEHISTTKSLKESKYDDKTIILRNRLFTREFDFDVIDDNQNVFVPNMFDYCVFLNIDHTLFTNHTIDIKIPTKVGSYLFFKFLSFYVPKKYQTIGHHDVTFLFNL